MRPVVCSRRRRCVRSARTSTRVVAPAWSALATSGRPRPSRRTRGGAGFPAAVKWRSVVAGGPGARYVGANGTEGEPDTFKDRALMRTNPYALLEGLLIAAEAVGARHAFIALKASFETELSAIRRTLAEIDEAGWLAGIDVTVVTGPEEYLFGEEKALLEVIEGNEPLPRCLPLYLHGLFATAPQFGWQAHEPDAADPGGHSRQPDAGDQRRDTGAVHVDPRSWR